MAATSTSPEATAVLTRPEVDELRERATAGRPPDLRPVGQCPYCHHDLVRREVRQQIDPHTIHVNVPIPEGALLLVYWACTNEECCLMFWKHPRTARWAPPIDDDLLEH